jgi:hypothetical protein
MIALEENRAREGHAATQAGRPRPADLPYKWSLQAPIFCRQVSLSFLSLCAQVFVPRTTVDIAMFPSLIAQTIHTLNPLKVHIPK